MSIGGSTTSAKTLWVCLRWHPAAGPHVKVSARPPRARRAHRAFSPSYAPVPLGRRRRGGACAAIRLHTTRGVTGSAAIDAAALFARRCPSRRAMACGKSSGRPDAPLSHLATGRPPRCARLPIGDSRALVPCIGTAPRLASAASAVALSSARRWLAGVAPAPRDRLDASSGVPEPWSLAHGVRDGRFACHTGAAVRGSEAGASADASQQATRGCSVYVSPRATSPPAAA